MSSSEDETSSPFKSNINVPRVELSKGQRSSSFVQKSKKLTGKSVRFPDLYHPRDTVISNDNTESDSDDEPSLSNIPSFKFQASEFNHDDDEDDNRSYERPQALTRDFSGSDSESGDEVYPLPRSTQEHSPQSDETDITDQLKKSTSQTSSSKTSQSDTKKSFRDIIRRVTLADRAYLAPGYAQEESNSDNFLGRILGSGNGGLSGGGLVPGASHNSQEKELDEEQRVGFNDDIEMTKVEPHHLNEEARNLISLHVPDAARMLENERVGSSRSHRDSDNSSSAHLVEGSSPESGGIQQPNSNFNVHENIMQDYNDDYMMDDNEDGIYVAPPKRVHAGVLSSLMKLYQAPQESKSSASLSSGPTTLADESTYDDSTMYGSKNTSTVDFTKLKSGIKKGGKMVTGLPGKLTGHHSKANSDDEMNEKQEFGETDPGDTNLPSFQNARPKAPKKTASGNKIPQIQKKLRKHKKQQNERMKITVHIADILQRQRFIMRMCKALMMFGAPTHRLEDYMVMTSRVLEIDGQFIYFPGCMIIAFGDAATRTSEVHLVKTPQGLNLSKLSDCHSIYKNVIHDLIGVEEAAIKIEELFRRKNKFSPWVCVFLYGLGSAAVTPFAFSGNWYDVPIAFGIGLCVGYLQFFVSSMSNLYSSVFEVTASIVVSFIARAIGSIRGGNIFCFGAIAQGSLALILPGYIILCGSLELQSKSLVAGSVRMFYAIIYSLFLGFGITLGASLYGWVDLNATNSATCDSNHVVDDKWRILFVPLFSCCLALINQARWRQLPVMVVISSIGYIGNYFASKHFQEVTEFTAAIGAFIIGILGNMYSRIWKGMAVSAMLPAIFVQVPSGIASKSTLLAGIDSANQITNSDSSSSSTSSLSSDVSSLSFGATMVEVSIGISVGLFAAALVVYPFGKRKTSLFTL